MLISSTLARNGVRLIFTHELASITYGPFVEHRPIGTQQDYDNFIENHRIKLQNTFVELEIAKNIFNAISDIPFIAPTFIWCTPNQLRLALREVYKEAKAYIVCRFAWYINQLNLTDTQLKTMFSVNDAQLITLKARLDELEDKYNNVKSEIGQ